MDTNNNNNNNHNNIIITISISISYFKLVMITKWQVEVPDIENTQHFIQCSRNNLYFCTLILLCQIRITVSIHTLALMFLKQYDVIKAAYEINSLISGVIMVCYIALYVIFHVYPIFFQSRHIYEYLISP